MGLPWTYTASGQGGCEGEKHPGALEDQKALSPGSWECHVSHGKDLLKWVECQGRFLKIISGDSLGRDSYDPQTYSQESWDST